jgi:hypothetical protein
MKDLSIKTIENTFEFLEEVTYATKKNININNIKVLWKIKNCRTYLLKFLRKYRFRGDENKSQQKIIYKQLDSNTIR